MDTAGNITDKSRRVLEALAAGRSHGQIVEANPDITYLDICAAADEALRLLGRPAPRALRMTAIKAAHARAYAPWSVEEEARLRVMHADGSGIREMATVLQRQPSAIASRLRKLGLR